MLIILFYFYIFLLKLLQVTLGSQRDGQMRQAFPMCFRRGTESMCLR